MSAEAATQQGLGAAESGRMASGPAGDRRALEHVSVLTRYRLVRSLGTGGMATVYLATIEKANGFSRNVALKLVCEDFARFPEFKEAFATEASLAAQLNHPNIVSIFDYHHDESGRPLLIMEVVNGVDLRAVIHQPMPMPFSVITFILTEVLRGLSHAHQLPRESGLRGIVHRDISPHNVLLSWEGAVKLTDFGIAKALTTTSGMISGSGHGKPAYMSPEQVRGASLDRRTDLFSLGVVCWEMLTGTQLFKGSHQEILESIATRPILAPSHFRSDVPRDLERIAMKLLERNRERRHASTREVLDELARCRDSTAQGAEDLKAMLLERFPDRLRSLVTSEGSETSPADDRLGHETLTEAAPSQQAARRWSPALVLTLAGVLLGLLAVQQLWPRAAAPPRHDGASVAAPAPELAPPPAPSAAPPGFAAEPTTAGARSSTAPEARAVPSATARGLGEKGEKKEPRGVKRTAAPSTPPRSPGILEVRFDGSNPASGQ